jgi:glycerol-1-phosphate dehydrogenase [NAD(P)+]
VRGPRPPQQPTVAADQAWAAALGSRAHRAGADAIVGIGGGRCLDIAKLAAARAGLAVVSVPTQLSHDGICSPVAVVPGADGRPESVGALAPAAVFLSLPTLVGAPAPSVAAGIGDLLANPLALRDWALAVERGLEPADRRAWDLSVESFNLIEGDLDSDPAHASKDPEFLRRLADALVLSGMAMICSGTSRPASGGEHEVSHAVDELYGGRALHGAQVAFGCIFSIALYGEDTDVFRRRLRRLGLPDDPRSLGLSEDEVVDVLLRAPETRPGRFTILEASDLDRKSARALVKRIWG